MKNKVMLFRAAFLVLVIGFVAIQYGPMSLDAQENPAAGTVTPEKADKGAVTPEKADKGAEAGKEAGKENAPEAVGESDAGGNAHLSEATKFRMDPAAWTLLILGMFGLAIAMERYYFIYIKKPSRNDDLSKIISDNLKPSAHDIEKMMAAVQDKKFGAEGRVVAKALRGWAFGEESMTKFAESGMEREKRTLDKRLVVLSTLGNNSPFIGLLGTVLGILKAFRDLANSADAGPAVVMHGISEALWATAFGLVVAIPAVIIYNLFSKAVKSKLSNAQEMIDLLLAVRVAYEEDPNAAKNVNMGESQN